MRADATLNTQDSYTVPIGVRLAPGMHRFSVTATLANGQRRGGFVEVEVGHENEFTVDPSTILNADGGSITQAQQENIRNALNFENLDTLPSGNRAILEYLINHYLVSNDTEELFYKSSTELRGKLHGTGLMQCKEWLQQVVIENSTGITVANNADDLTTAEWKSDDGKDYTIGKMIDAETFQAMLTRVNTKAGDVIQWYGAFGKGGSMVPHTMIIGKITSDGIWVFDTNMGNLSEDLYDNDGNPYVQEDNTVRYHLIEWSSLNDKVMAGTVHRVP